MTEGTKDLRGVDTKPRGHEPMKLGRHDNVAGGRSEVITESARHYGINPDNVHTTARHQRYADGAGEAHRAAMRGDKR